MKSSLQYDGNGMLPASIDLIHEHQYVYWLIDPVLHRPEIDLVTRDGWQVEPIPIKDNSIIEQDRPYLVTAELDELHKHADVFFNAALKEQQANIKLATPRSYCAWIASDLNAKKLAAKLAAHAIITTYTGEQRIFRYWDPRVLQHTACQSDAPMILPLEIQTVWTFIDSLGYVNQVGNKSMAAHRAISNPLDEVDANWLQMVDKRNRLFKQIGQHIKQADNLWQCLDTHLYAVKQLKVSRIEDHIILAAMRYQHNIMLEYSPTVHDCLKQSQQHEIPLSALLLDWDEQQWLKVKAECENNKSKQT